MTGLTQEYVLSKPRVWREEILKEAIKQQIQEKRWDIQTALLSHTPMSEEAGKSLRSQIREIEKDFKAILRSLGIDRVPSKDDPVVSKFEIHSEPGENISDLLQGIKR